MLALDGHVLAKQQGIVGEEVFHKGIVDAGDRGFTLRIGIAVDEIAGVVAEGVVGNACADGTTKESE